MRFVALLLTLLVCAASQVAAQTRPAAPAPSAGQIDINSASRDELMNLEGIGEMRADAIIRARPFKVKTELVERRLVTEAMYEKISDKVMARAAPNTPAAPARTPTPTTRR